MISSMSSIAPFINAKGPSIGRAGWMRYFFWSVQLGHTQSTHSTLALHGHTRVRVGTHIKNRLGDSLASGVLETHSTTECARVYPNFSREIPEKRYDTRVWTLVGNVPLDSPSGPHVLRIDRVSERKKVGETKKITMIHCLMGPIKKQTY
jgi:hypothetical protein